MFRILLFLAALSFLAIPVDISAKLASPTDSSVVTDFNKFLLPGEYRGMLRLDERNRQFIIVTPPGLKTDHSVPIVFFFHGAGGTAEQAARTYGWVEKARKEKFIVVFPQGLGAKPDRASSFLLNPNIWRDERPDIPNLVNDVQFFQTLLTELQTVLPVDPRRVYVTGFSNGAGMTFTLGAHFSDRIAAIAPVSSRSNAGIDKLARPLPVYYLVGIADPLLRYHGGTVTLPWGKTRTVPPVQETIDEWAALDGCPILPTTVSDKDGVRIVRYGPGHDGAEMLFTTIEGNGHHWPDTIEPLPVAIAGPSLDPFSATDRIWEFFKKHPLRGHQ